MHTTGFWMVAVGMGGSMLLWLCAIRPHVQRHGPRITSAGHLSVAPWVDWQNCRTLAAEENDTRARTLARTFLALQLLALAGGLLVIAAISG